MNYGTTRRTGYAISLSCRWLIEKRFGWLNRMGPARQVKVRGLHKVDWIFVFTCAAHNLLRLPKADRAETSVRHRRDTPEVRGRASNGPPQGTQRRKITLYDSSSNTKQTLNHRKTETKPAILFFNKLLNKIPCGFIVRLEHQRHFSHGNGSERNYQIDSNRVLALGVQGLFESGHGDRLGAVGAGGDHADFGSGFRFDKAEILLCESRELVERGDAFS